MALVIPTLILVLLAVLEIVVVARIQLDLVAAAREGARVAAAVPNPEAAVDAVNNALSARLSESARITVVRPGVVGRPATVTVRFAHRLVTPIMRWYSVDLSGKATMRVEK